MSTPFIERRQSLRVPLGTPYLLTMQTEDGQKYLMLLTDMSVGGVQLGATPGISLKTLVNVRNILSDLPEEVSLLEGCKGVIVWATDRYCGVRFDQQLDCSTEELLRIATNEPLTNKACGK